MTSTCPVRLLSSPRSPLARGRRGRRARGRCAAHHTLAGLRIPARISAPQRWSGSPASSFRPRRAGARAAAARGAACPPRARRAGRRHRPRAVGRDRTTRSGWSQAIVGGALRVAVQDQMWARFALRLRAALDPTELVAAGPTMSALRRVKNPEEVDRLRAAAVAADAAWGGHRVSGCRAGRRPR